MIKPEIRASTNIFAKGKAKQRKWIKWFIDGIHSTTGKDKIYFNEATKIETDYILYTFNDS